MGGRGSVRDWYSNQLFFKDGIHLSKKGYRYQGDLFFEAFIKLKDLKD
jgi:lysophospholipase L1-like esterase